MDIKKRISILEKMLKDRVSKRNKIILRDKLAGFFNSDSFDEVAALVLTIYDLKKTENEQFLQEYRNKGLCV